jgi:ribosome biogenesis GTPase
MMIKGRIIRGIGGLYYVAVDTEVYECSARGKFRKSRITPTVGDYVEISVTDEQKHKGSIESICQRRNTLIRPRVANVDCAVIQFAAASPDINYDLLDRFLILAGTQGIKDVVICINKSDLLSNEVREYMERVYAPIYSLVFTCAAKNEGIDELREKLKGKVTVFAGPSGVGKSSVINALIPDMERKTGEISKKIQRGKHTTREVELLEYDKDTFIVDSPGFTSLSLDFLQAEGLKHYFREFEPYLDGCYFNDCSHISEPDCTLKEHVGKEIAPERYERFVGLYNELKQRR